MKVFRAGLGIAALLALCLFGLRLAYPLPDRTGVTESFAIAPDGGTSVGAAVLRAEAGQGGKSAVIPLAGGGEAFAARVLLARAAERSLDVQYYIWQDDTTGRLLLDELRAAAMRGVRVRLLLDDNGIAGLDAALRGLDDLPDAEVRLFNPFVLRSPKLLSFGFDFFRLNRRMHNKSFTADGAASIVGGRNVGDIYFAYGPDEHYIDTDILAAGPAAREVSASFDAYWNSASAYPAGMVLPAAPDGLAWLQAGAEAARGTDMARAYADAVAQSPAIAGLLGAAGGVEWAKVTLLADDPRKGLGEQAEGGLLVDRLAAVMTGPMGPKRSVDLVSAYFVPGAGGTALLTGLTAQGVAVRVLTNAQEATDVVTVHGAYANYRKVLLAGGVVLGELRADPLVPEQDRRLAVMLARSATSLHSKVFAIDGERVFIGSFNFDPRSATLNTEMGFLVESPTLAAAMSRGVDAVMDKGAYRLGLSSAGGLEWRATGLDGAETVYGVEPGTSWLERMLVAVIGMLPVEWLM